jgi:hypothetical protein
VPGTFVYSPAAGTVLPAGTNTLSVTFTPTDTAGYTTAMATVTLSVVDFSLSVTGSSTQTVTAGQAATFNFSVVPVGSTTLLAPVSLTVSGLPPGATYTVTPQVVPGGSPATSVNLVIQTAKLSAAWNTEPQGFELRSAAPIVLTLLLLPLLGMQSFRKRVRLAPRLATVLLFASLSLGAAMGLSGCSGFPSNPSGSTTYNVVVTETSGTLQHSFNLTLIVRK